MSDFLAAKGPSEVVQRRWLVPVDSDDGASSVSAVATGVTKDSATLEGDEVVLTLSAGTAATTGSIAVTVTTSRGRTLIETLYIPIVAPGSTATTVRDLVNFALRKVAGISETPDEDQAEDARERLQDMLELWRQAGADVGATRPLTLSTVIYCPESFLAAIKNNLIIEVADLYNAEVSPVVVRNATTGLAHIKQTNLSDVRKDTYF